MSFQIYSIDNPDYLKAILPLFQSNSSFTSQELSDRVTSVGFSVHPRRSRHLLQIWYVLGILNRSKDKGGAFRYQISKFGNELLNKLRFNESLAIDICHWAWYSAWLRSPDFEKAWSWLYQDVCNLLWESSPQVVVIKQLTADSVERASALYHDEVPALDNASIGSVLSWLAAMNPPFLTKKGNGDSKKSWESQRRESCNPELIYLAIQLQYTLKNLSLDTHLLIDENLITDICRVCMLKTEAFWPMVDMCILTFPAISRKETTYGTSLIVSQPAPFSPPDPRYTKKNSS